MKRKLLITLLAVVSCLACALGLAACDGDGGGNTQHSHIWSQSWERNETHHWHNCTAENCTVTDNSQKDGYAEHDFTNGDCAVCGKKPALKYTLNDDGKSYTVTGINQDVADIVIVAEYNGKPVTSIGDYAFSGCSNLESVYIPDSVTSIGDHAFYYCSNLESVTIGNGVTSIGDSAFDGCSSLQYKEYDNAYYLGNAGNPYVVLIKAKDTSITSCTINSKTKVIYYSAFENCSALTSITIPDGVTTIGDYAFENCSALTSITIPDGVTTIGDRAFYDCGGLKYNEHDNAYYLGNAGNPYVVLIKAKDTSITNCTINSKTKVICSWAFNDCSNLTSITIPDSVTTIGDSAFENCSNLESVYIPDSVTSIGSSAFYNCSALTTITIPDSVTTIGDYAFSVCSSLRSITIPDSVTSIGSEAFSYCDILTGIIFEGTKEQWDDIEKGSDWDLSTDHYTIYCTDGEIGKG